MYNKEEEVENKKNSIASYQKQLKDLDGIEAVGYRLAIKKLKEEIKNLESDESAIDYLKRKGNYFDVDPF